MKSFLSFIVETTAVAPAILAANMAATSDSGYKIQSGDTLSKIAQQNDTTVDDILRLNPSIKDPNRINAGQTLKLSDNSQESQPQPEQPQLKPEQTQPKSKPQTQTPAWNPLISEFEGVRTDAYWDDKGKVWTIGKGSTTHPDGTPVKRGDRISKDQANQYMQHYVDKNVLPVLSKRIPNWGQMNPNQQSALVSFAYNVGPNFYGKENFQTITNALSNQQNWSQVPNALKMYNKSGGEVLRGLERRRAAEAALWLTKN